MGHGLAGTFPRPSSLNDGFLIAPGSCGVQGVYYGALLAPVVHDRLGIVNIMWAFAAFLLATAVLFMQI